MRRYLAIVVIALVAGLSGGFAGAYWAKVQFQAGLASELEKSLAAQQQSLQAQAGRLASQETQVIEVARRTMTLINGLTSLAVDSEIVAADLAELRNRMDELEIRNKPGMRR